MIRTHCWLLALCLFVPGPARAQGVLVAPHALFIDHQTRSGWIQLHNPGAEPAEVSLSLLFGYPVTDSLGYLELRLVEQPDSTFPSAMGWIQAFPRRMVVPPQGHQTIRLMVRPPANLADGEYWARVMIAAKGGTAPIQTTDTTTGIQVGLTLEVRTILPLLYRKGTLQTGVVLSQLRAERVGDSLVVRTRMARSGSAVFLGTVTGALVDQAGTEVAGFQAPISVYYDIEPRFALSMAGLPPGGYRLRLEVASSRDDIAPELVIPAATVRDSIPIRVR